jgi:cytochrome c biogenesis protein CcmG/thiol:disulfide interchange protein DsbE
MTEHSLSPRILTIFMLALIVLLVIVNEKSWIRDQEPDPTELIGTKLPPLSVTTLSGEDTLLSDLQRQFGLLIVFSTTCEYCLEELRFWESKRMELSHVLDIRCISVNTAEMTTEFLSEHSIELPAYVADHTEIRERFRINRVPSLFIMNKEGIITAYYSGAVSKERIVEKLKELLHVQSGSRNEN